MQISASPPEQAVAALFKAVADPTRVRIMAAIVAAGELCVCHVEAAVGITQSRASRHLATLKRAGLLADRRDGAWVHYRLPPKPDPAVRAIVRVVKDAFAADPTLQAIAARAAELRADAGCAGGGR